MLPLMTVDVPRRYGQGLSWLGLGWGTGARIPGWKRVDLKVHATPPNPRWILLPAAPVRAWGMNWPLRVTGPPPQLLSSSVNGGREEALPGATGGQQGRAAEPLPKCRLPGLLPDTVVWASETLRGSLMHWGGEPERGHPRPPTPASSMCCSHWAWCTQ